jgi:hypothetical protein
MFTFIASAIVILITGVLLLAATRPGSFLVHRSIGIKAAPEKIFPFINDLRLWGAWSPYEKLDPGMKRDFSGPASGEGAVYAWQGNNKIGRGSMEIIGSSAPTRVLIQLDMISPCEGHNIVEFTLQSKGGVTEVTWDIDGPMDYFGKLVSVFISMDKMIGGQHETGLANLKALVEQPGAVESAQLLRPVRYSGATASSGVAAI